MEFSRFYNLKMSRMMNLAIGVLLLLAYVSPAMIAGGLAPQFAFF